MSKEDSSESTQNLGNGKKAKDSSKNEKHGDDDKAKQQIEIYKEQLKTAKGKEKIKLKKENTKSDTRCTIKSKRYRRFMIK